MSPIFTDPSATEDFRLEPGQDLVLVDSEGNEVLRIDAGGVITLRAAGGDPVLRLAGRQGNLSLGGAGVDGDMLLFPNGGDVTAAATTATIKASRAPCSMRLRTSRPSESVPSQ